MGVSRGHGRARHAVRSRISAPPSPGSPLALATSAHVLTPSPTLEINELIAQRRAEGQRVIHLGFGEASFPLHPVLREALATYATRTSYAPVLGIEPLREAVAAYLTRTRGFSVGPAQVAVAPGSKPLLYALFQVLAGDVLMPVPSWVSYAPQAKLAGKRVILVPSDPADHTRLPVESLRAATARARHSGLDPRILVVNSPNNPTGCMFAPEDVEAMTGWARDNGITIISDEIYSELAHGWRAHVSPAVFYPEGTIVTGGFSKAFSAGGWRLGYAVLPPGERGVKLMSAVRALASEIWSSASTPVQFAAARAYAAGEEIDRYVRRSARLHGHVTGRLQADLARLGVLAARPSGGFYAYADFTPWRHALSERGVTSGAELSRHLLDEWGIAALPGVAFGDGPEHLRLRLATSGLYSGPDEPASDREAHLWSLLERADTLPVEDPASGEPFDLPMLDETVATFARFVESLGAPEATGE